MSYGTFFAAPEAVRYISPDYPLAGRNRLNSNERVRRLPIQPRGPLRGMNRPPGGRNRQNPPDHAYFLPFEPPPGYPSHPNAPGPLVPWDLTETESEARIMRYGRNRQNLLSAPRSCPFFGVQTAARLPTIPMPLGPWSPGTQRKRNRRPRS